MFPRLIERIPSHQCEILSIGRTRAFVSWEGRYRIDEIAMTLYAQRQLAAFIRAPGMQLLCLWMCRTHCHRLIKLWGTLGNVAPVKELVENAHGVHRTFLDVGGDLKGWLDECQ